MAYRIKAGSGHLVHFPLVAALTAFSCRGADRCGIDARLSRRFVGLNPRSPVLFILALLELTGGARCFAGRADLGLCFLSLEFLAFALQLLLLRAFKACTQAGDR